MNTRNIFLSVIIIFAAPAIANAQGIDSTQWPFPDTLGFMSDLYGTIQDTLNQIDNSHDIIRKVQIPGTYWAYPSPKYFTWRDAEVDSNEWHFQADGQLAENNLITLDIELDTVRQKISSWNYHHSIADMFSIEGATDIILTDINYNHSGLSFPDNDLYRHLEGIYLSYDGGHSDARWYYTLIELDSLSIWGQTLIPAFQVPRAVYFGFLSIGTSNDRLIKLRNVSNTPLTITSYALSDPDSGFMLFDTSLHIIPANDSGIIIARFMPRKGQYYTGSIEIRTDEPYARGYTIGLSGDSPYTQLLLPEYPGDFTANVGDTVKEYAKLSNIGTVAATIDSFLLEGSTEFSVDSPRTPFVIGANNSSLLLLTFHPHSVGDSETTLIAKATDGAEAQTELKGTGVAPNSVAISNPQENDKLHVVPTVADGHVHIYLPSSAIGAVILSIRNILGEEIASRHLQIDPGDNTEYFETSNFPSGTYFAEFDANGKVSQTRFIVQH